LLSPPAASQPSTASIPQPPNGRLFRTDIAQAALLAQFFTVSVIVLKDFPRTSAAALSVSAGLLSKRVRTLCPMVVLGVSVVFSVVISVVISVGVFVVASGRRARYFRVPAGFLTVPKRSKNRLLICRLSSRADQLPLAHSISKKCGLWGLDISSSSSKWLCDRRAITIFVKCRNGDFTQRVKSPFQWGISIFREEA
jgi:hypothetical protein